MQHISESCSSKFYLISISRTWVTDELVRDFCGDSYQCKYDYATTLSKEFAMFSKYYQDQFINIYEDVLKPEKIVMLELLIEENI